MCDSCTIVFICSALYSSTPAAINLFRNKRAWLIWGDLLPNVQMKVRGVNCKRKMNFVRASYAKPAMIWQAVLSEWIKWNIRSDIKSDYKNCGVLKGFIQAHFHPWKGAGHCRLPARYPSVSDNANLA
jgi:hypothetical protein